MFTTISTAQHHLPAILIFSAIGMSLGSAAVQAADAAAGKTAAQACSACHGINGVSIAPVIPNLAAQKAKYIAGQLAAFKSGKRKHPIMAPIAKRLDKKLIGDLAAYFSSLPGAAPGGASKARPEVNATRVPFPNDYKASYTRYMSKNFPKRGQLRHYYANKPAVAAAKAGAPMPNGAVFFTEVFKIKKGADGKPLKGADGLFVADKLILHTAMAKGDGWGKAIPALFRNGGWNYALFMPNGKQRTKGFNHAACLGCHLPLKAKDYVFSLDALVAKVKN
jgi:cytochrome c553